MKNKTHTTKALEMLKVVKGGKFITLIVYIKRAKKSKNKWLNDVKINQTQIQ